MTNPKVASVLTAYPEVARARHGELHRLLSAEAERLDVGPLTETLKWGQPSYLTEATGSGTTVRLAWSDKDPDRFRVYVHCQTSLVEEWRAKFGEALTFEGNRAINLPIQGDLPADALSQCFASALTYHRK